MAHDPAKVQNLRQVIVICHQMIRSKEEKRDENTHNPDLEIGVRIGDPGGRPNRNSPEAAYMQSGVSNDAISRTIKLRILRMRKLGKALDNLLRRKRGRTMNAPNLQVEVG